MAVKSSDFLGIPDLQAFEYWTITAWFAIFGALNIVFLAWALSIVRDKSPPFSGPSKTRCHRDFIHRLADLGYPIPRKFPKRFLEAGVKIDNDNIQKWAREQWGDSKDKPQTNGWDGVLLDGAGKEIKDDKKKQSNIRNWARERVRWDGSGNGWFEE